ncbi:glycoside hydrolase [Thermoclostridium stercorarium subsp. leptospartum DSM 9219]|uniref:Glycoside hydrolase n=1 Tax=Thermoclostridium stercorarium subsp. leptospartum DSM 9219 TaxID=1346611 RepID=A0A1B1YJF5_THEST|nr:glycoside hydrolase [Thermoclostridium stercorarium subsp. leptospartum DSM 9219]
MNRKVLFNDGWEFAKTALGFELGNIGSLKFEPVDIPHDWLIFNTLDLYENSIGWYRKKFTVEKKPDQMLLYFDGVYMDSTLYVNGQFAGEWKYGYSSFEHDITDFVKEGNNEIIMKVVHQSPNSRWYSGAGIYRNVWLKTRSKNHIVTDGIYITTRCKGEIWEVEVDTEYEITDDVQISHKIIRGDKIIASSKDFVKTGGNSGLNTQKLYVEKPLLWSCDEPNLYKLVTQMELVKTDENGRKTVECIECVTQNIGFRTIILDPDQGLILNGKKIKLNGVCEHHDLGALGAAFNKAALIRRFKLLKEMGVNAIRTAHNMPAPELMDLADEMGFLVLSEAFDMWERPKTTYDYARFFGEWAYRDVKSWVKRDRNHPSLLMWSIGNEIYDTHADERGQEITRMLMNYVREFDPKGNAQITIASNYMAWENAQKCADILKIAGYNYAEHLYYKHHKEHPDWVIFGSETSSVVQSRGVYHFPFEQAILSDEDEQCSALGNSTVSWGAKSVEACIIAERDTPFSLGQFIWTGFDYIGEPTPYHTKNSYFGQLDTATFKKDSFYIFQAAWTDYKTNPMVHIFPYWDFNEGQIIDVRVCSNAPRIELQLNGVTIGTHDIDFKHGKQLVGWWKIPYREGELKAIAYDENGNVIATDVKRSFKDARRICLKPDREVLVADGRDLIFVEINVVDENGIEVENASNRVFVNVTGAGRLVGLDNGDSTDFDQYKGLSRRLFNGKLMAIVAATLEPGSITVEVTSKGLEGCRLELQSIPPEGGVIEGVSANMRNSELPCVTGNFDEIPVRKIELVAPADRMLNPSNREIIIEAKLYPENASYREVEWSAVNDAGIKSNIVKVEPMGLKAKITALGDGEFRIRCTSRNGTDKTRLISQLEFKAEGLGVVYKNPYEFVYAGLYDYSKGEISSGNEKGIATGREGESQVGFENLDFGPDGSDTVTIPIFALTSEPHYFQIWEGVPYKEGSTLLADAVYQKESIYNVYQEEIYKLSKTLRGITSVYFVFNRKVHMKGFVFERKNRAYERNMAAWCDKIYGDNYEIRGDFVERIGNNVSLEFDNMDFGEEGVSKVIISGRAPIDNTIHIRFENEQGQDSRLVEFKKSDEYTVKVFELEKVSGRQKVTFLFLPGSNFDFGWFKFEK